MEPIHAFKPFQVLSQALVTGDGQVLNQAAIEETRAGIDVRSLLCGRRYSHFPKAVLSVSQLLEPLAFRHDPCDHTNITNNLNMLSKKYYTIYMVPF